MPHKEDPHSALPQILKELSDKLYLGQQDGVEIKEWFTGQNHEFWMAKAGQEPLGYVAMPIHEAIIPWIYRAVGVTTNSVALGSRKLGVPLAQGRGNLLLSLHKYRRGVKRQVVDASWRPDAKFFEDYAVMSCVDHALGQVDRHNGNYMVLDDGTLFAVDNGRCLSNGFINVPVQETVFDTLKLSGGLEGHPWTTETDFVRQRIENLTDNYIDQVFDSIPRLWFRLHDIEVSRDPSPMFQSSSLDTKAIQIKANLQILRSWLARQ